MHGILALFLLDKNIRGKEEAHESPMTGEVLTC
jgi:hypothetical protein